MMDNSEGHIYDTMEYTLEFLKEKYPLENVIVDNEQQ